MISLLVYLVFAIITYKKKIPRDRTLLYFALVQSLMFLWLGTLPFDYAALLSIVVCFLLYLDEK